MLKCLRIASFKEFFWIVEREVFLSLMRSKLRAVFVPFGGQKVTWGRARRTELQKTAYTLSFPCWPYYTILVKNFFTKACLR